MRVIEVREFGGPEVLELREVPDPVAGPGQAVIRVAAADVIFLDTFFRSGAARSFFPDIKPPFVPGNGGSGEVVAVGEGVDAAWVGRRVVASAPGGYAELTVVPEHTLVPVPEGLGLREAAAVLHDGSTAVGLARQADFQKEEWVLVTAAAGGAGSLLVQLARTAGARVIAAARGERKLALVRDLGAEFAVDYSDEGWEARVRELTGGSGVDAVLDGAGGRLGLAAFDVVVDGGRFITYGTASGEFAAVDPQVAERRRVRVVNPLADKSASPPKEELIAQALDLVASGRIRPSIHATYPLERAADAHTALAERTTVGKSLLLA